jgi:hypothetical protein
MRARSRYRSAKLLSGHAGRGRFKKFQHDHHLVEIDGRTWLNDKLRFAMPWGQGRRASGTA